MSLVLQWRGPAGPQSMAAIIGPPGPAGPGGGSSTPRVLTVPSAGTVTPDAALYDQLNVTAQATALSIAGPGGTPVDGQKLTLRIRDDGAARSIAWNAIYRAVGVTLPTTTTPSSTLYVQAVFNAAEAAWDVLIAAHTAALVAWLLAGGVWNDAGAWNDSSVWEDS